MGGVTDEAIDLLEDTMPDAPAIERAPPSAVETPNVSDSDGIIGMMS
jgi:hypothetical protein